MVKKKTTMFMKGPMDLETRLQVLWTKNVRSRVDER